MDTSLYILDDDLYFGRCMKKQLERVTENVKYYKTERNFIKALNRPPDVVVIDYQLSISNGLMIMDEMKRLGVWPEIVMVSSQSDAQIALRAYRNGALAYFEKSPKVFEQVRKTVVYLAKASNNFKQPLEKDIWQEIWKNVEGKR